MSPCKGSGQLTSSGACHVKVHVLSFSSAKVHQASLVRKESGWDSLTPAVFASTQHTQFDARAHKADNNSSRLPSKSVPVWRTQTLVPVLLVGHHSM